MNRKRLFPAALLPLAILPATIATACSTSDSSDTKAQVNQEVTRLNNLIQSGKLHLSNPELTKTQITTVTSNNDALIDLLDQASLALKRTNFDYHIVELGGLSAADMRTTAAKTMHFKFKVISKTDSKQSLLSVLASLQYQVKAEVVPPTQPDTSKIDAFITTIKQAKTAGTFKLASAYQTMTKAQVEALIQDKMASNFMSKYFEGYPQASDQLTTTVKSVTFNETKVVTSQQVLKLQLTIADPSTKVQKDTEMMDFSFTLTKADPVTAQSLKANIEDGAKSNAFHLTKTTIPANELEQLKNQPANLLTDAYSNWNEFVKTLEPTNYTYEIKAGALTVQDSTSSSGKKEIQFTITITHKSQASDTAVTDALKFVVDSTRINK